MKTKRQTPPARPAGMTLEAESDGFVEAFEQGESAQWRQGRHWHNLVTYELWRDGPYSSSLDFLRRVARGRKVPRASDLSDWASVAVAFDEPIAVREGMDRLLDLLRIRKKAGRPDVKGDPADELIDVPQKDGSVLHKRFADCSEHELREALGARGKKKSKPKSPAAKSLADLLQAFAAENALAWSVDDAKRGKLTVTLSGDANALRKALRLSPPLDARHFAIAEGVEALLFMKRSLDAPLEFSAQVADDGSVHYTLSGIGERSYPANFDAAKQALQQVLDQFPAGATGKVARSYP
jgi:hypothetical protein